MTAFYWQIMWKVSKRFLSSTATRDITNSIVNGVNAQDIEKLNDFIIKIIVKHDCTSEEAVGDSPLHHALGAILQIRNGHNDYKAAVLRNLNQLNKTEFDSKNSRELLYGGAALAWFEGNYTKASQLFETICMHNPHDVIALKFAQELHVKTRNKNNVLGCVSRHQAMADTKMAASVHGMQSFGYNECGRLQDSEEIATRACGRTKNKDFLALHSLLNCFQLTGRSSEVISRVADNLTHYTGSALIMLRGNLGIANIMRGNYTGGIKIIHSMLEIIEIENQNGNLPSSSSLTAVIQVFWYLLLSNNELEAEVIVDIWQQIIKYINHSNDPMFDLWSFVAYSSCQHYMKRVHESGTKVTATSETTEAIKQQIIDGDNGANEEPSSPAKWKLFTWFNRKHIKGTTLIGAKKDITYKFSDEKQYLDEKLVENKKLSLSNKFSNPTKEDIHVNAGTFAQLRSVVSVMNIISDHNDSYNYDKKYENEYHESLVKGCRPLAHAFDSFSSFNYQDASKYLTDTQHCKQYLGSTRIGEDFIDQTKLESYFRSGQLAQSKMLLQERAWHIPHDAQVWRKLAMLHSAEGDNKAAEKARYTAWQLGHGQGGFGGAK